MFHDRDWKSENAPRILDFINGANNVWNVGGNKAPHDIIKSFKLSKHGKIIKSKDLNNNVIRTGLEQVCLEGLLWGLANPDRFKTWYESWEKIQKDQLPVMQNAGLTVNSVPTLSIFLKDSEEILKGYENEIAPLPTIPSRLLADVRALGREINNTIHSFDSLNNKDDSQNIKIEDILKEGISYFKKQDYQSALDKFNHAIFIDNKNKYAYYYRAITNDKLGNKNTILSDIKVAAKLGHQKAIDFLKQKRIEY